jgi:N-methylhydantoinase A
VNLRVSGIGPITRPELCELPALEGTRARACGGFRQVCFDGQSPVDTRIYRRAELAPGDQIDGPSIIEEFGATVPIHPGFRARVDRYGNLVVTR